MRLPEIHFEDQLVGDLSDHSNRKYHKPPSEYDEQVWHLGWTDGRYGQPPETNESVLRAEAKLKWQQSKAATEAEAEAARARVRGLEAAVERQRPRLERMQESHLDMVAERSRSPQAYSLSLWAIYTSVAFILFAADLPLSLKLVAMGYGVTTKDDFYSVDDLLTNFGYVTYHFWEAMLLAFGIALSGVFVKFFIDSVVFRDENQAAGRIFRVFILSVLALFLTTIVLLGFFRASVQRDASIDQLRQEAESLDEKNSQRPNPDLTKAIKRIEQQIEDKQREDFLSIRTGSFILLTLLFPIVGGICFAVGWRKAIKYWQYGRLEKRLREVEDRFDAHLQRYESERGVLATLEQKFNREFGDYATADAYVELRVSLYRHGYMRGRNVPETIDADASLYERCENSVAKLLAKRMRNKYWDDTPATARP